MLRAFHDFPAEHRKHFRTTNPIESTIATLRPGTTETKGCFSPMTALNKLFKPYQPAGKKWRRLHGPHPLAEIVRGVKYKDGEKPTVRAA